MFLLPREAYLHGKRGLFIWKVDLLTLASLSEAQASEGNERARAREREGERGTASESSSGRKTLMVPDMRAHRRSMTNSKPSADTNVT